MVHTVKDKADLDQILEKAGDKLVVIDFFAQWCGPCKMIAPVVEELEKESAEKPLVIIKVDVEECDDIAMEYEISSMPTFVFIKNSKKIDQFCGANVQKLKDTIEKLI